MNLGSNFINLEGIEKGEKVVVAMSGGVDSSVCAYLLHNSGYVVIGATLKLFDNFIEDDAKLAAKSIGIPHHFIDIKDSFKNEVIDYFGQSYANGTTPSPCAMCNKKIKFPELIKFCKKVEAKILVTGHYARIISKNSHNELHKIEGTNEILKKDQSYFLSLISQECIDCVRFLLVDKIKTRKLVKSFEITDKPDSQDVCFIKDKNYKKYLFENFPEAFEEGKIRDLSGKLLGTHNGIANYTIGQRKGLGVSNKEPLFVIGLNVKNNEVVVGTKDMLSVKKIILRDINWLIKEPEEEFDCLVKIRSCHLPVMARMNPVSKIVKFNVPEIGVAPGQVCAMYLGSRVIGGGFISPINELN